MCRKVFKIVKKTFFGFINGFQEGGEDLENVLNVERQEVKFLPNVINFQQYQHHVTIEDQMFTDIHENFNLLKHVLARRKLGLWLQHYAQSAVWKVSQELRSQNALEILSIVKIIMIVFFGYSDGQSCYDFYHLVVQSIRSTN